MRVWIDGDLCTGVALCENACPDVFKMAADGIAHVVDPSGQLLADRTPMLFDGRHLEAVLDAAEGCPEECIYLDE